MRDYENLTLDLRERASSYEQMFGVGESSIVMKDAADAIEELQSQIAEAGKMVDELITYAQKNADESREAEKRFYGDDFTVSRYTWMHNQKCTHERYVEKLERIAMMFPDPPKEETE